MITSTKQGNLKTAKLLYNFNLFFLLQICWVLFMVILIIYFIDIIQYLNDGIDNNLHKGIS